MLRADVDDGDGLGRVADLPEGGQTGDVVAQLEVADQPVLEESVVVHLALQVAADESVAAVAAHDIAGAYGLFGAVRPAGVHLDALILVADSGDGESAPDVDPRG